MDWLALVLAGLSAVIMVIWLARHVGLSLAARRQVVLTADSFPAAREAAPFISVIVAAKDEQQSIRRCVETMLAQDYPNFEMIVVNDRSTDRTGPILEELARRDQRLRVVHVERLREGWFGKNNAMREGVQRARGQWFCFSDADCHYSSPRLLSVAMQYALKGQIDFLSVLPVLDVQSACERIVQPVCAAVLIFWFRPQRVNDPTSSVAYANGAFMLIRRQAYASLGGHEAVKTEVNEDIHLARLAKARGLRLAVVQNRGLLQTRMYSSLARIWSGWARIFYGCFGSLRRLGLTLFFLVLISLSPWFVAAAGWIVTAGLGWQQAGWWPVAAGAASLAVLAQWSVMLRFYGLSQADRRYAIAYPLGAMVCCGAILQAMLKVLGAPTTWRGTTYRRRRVVSQPR
ncbi:MAG: glycosyltransferase [Phycisphaerae bacterium]